MISKQCREHLEEVNELIIHAVAPRFFTKTATNAMKAILASRYA
jgi:hypothetical protein